jgi:uncharacterized protein YpiB (UPF0302 family)
MKYDFSTISDICVRLDAQEALEEQIIFFLKKRYGASVSKFLMEIQRRFGNSIYHSNSLIQKKPLLQYMLFIKRTETRQRTILLEITQIFGMKAFLLLKSVIQQHGHEIGKKVAGSSTGKSDVMNLYELIKFYVPTFSFFQEDEESLQCTTKWVTWYSLSYCELSGSDNSNYLKARILHQLKSAWIHGFLRGINGEYRYLSKVHFSKNKIKCRNKIFLK